MKNVKRGRVEQKINAANRLHITKMIKGPPGFTSDPRDESLSIV